MSDPMTPPADVREALDGVRCALLNSGYTLIDFDTIRAHLADLERQLAEAWEKIERRPGDVVIPLALYDEINAAGAQWKQRAETLIAQLAEATALRERDGKDARRYRWLREHQTDRFVRNNEHEPCLLLPFGADYLSPDEADAAIDAAIQARKQEGEVS